MCKKLLIGVSETSFNVSEALALFLFQAANEENTYEIQRVANPEDCDKYDVLIGVTPVFDAKFHRYPNSASKRYNLQAMKILYGYTEPLSTAGLVYAVHGWRLLKKFQPERAKETNLKYDFRRVFEFFIEIVDRFTFGQPIVYPTSEKEQLMKYLNAFSAELKTSLRNAFKNNGRDLDFLTIVDVYSSKIGARFHEMLNWYYYEYLRLTYELTKAMMRATSEHPTGYLAVCPFDFGKVTFKELLARAFKFFSRSKNVKHVLLLVMLSKDCYRVECLSPFGDDKPPTITFPLDWPVKGEQIKQVLGIPDVLHISDCGRHAITATKKAAVALAKSLIEHAVKLNLVPDPTIDATMSLSGASTRLSSSTKVSGSVEATSVLSECPSSESATKFKNDKSNNLVNYETEQTNERLIAEDGDADLKDLLGFESFAAADSDLDSKCTFAFDSLSVELPLADVSLVTLNDALRAKYPDLGDGYALCHRSNSRTAEATDFVRDTPWFWRRHHDEFVYAPICAPTPLKSVTSDDDDVYAHCGSETASSTFDDNTDEENGQIVESIIAVDFHTVFYSKFSAELLACAIVMAADSRPCRFVNITSLEQNSRRAVKIGYPNALCYGDASHLFNEKHKVSMLSLDMLSCEDRLSCAGIAFARCGLKSIAGVLEPLFGAKVCEKKMLCKVYRQVYARLIHPIDRLVAVDANGDEANVETATTEAKLYINIFGSGKLEPDTPTATDDEAFLQFRLNLAFARPFYQRLVVEVFRRFFPKAS